MNAKDKAALIKESAKIIGKEISDADADAIVAGVMKVMKKIAVQRLATSGAKIVLQFGAGALAAAVVGLSPWTGVGLVAVVSFYGALKAVIEVQAERANKKLIAETFEKTISTARTARQTKTSVADLFPQKPN